MTTLSLPRPRGTRPVAILAASLAVIASTQLLSSLGSQRPSMPTSDAPIVASVAQAQAANALGQIDRSIGVWSSNLAANDSDFLAARNLGLLYEARARLSGDVSDYARADEAANRSLAIEPRQVDVQALHARILLATHDFSGALEAATIIDRSTPNEPAVLGIIGDASLELGDVDRAAAIFGRIGRIEPGPAVTARLARIAFLQGDTAGAVSLAATAHADAEATGETGPSLSWYAYLAGTLSMSAGEPEAAAGWFDRALADWP
jgi:tetratricopeptide (TPR) repeat protein